MTQINYWTLSNTAWWLRKVLAEAGFTAIVDTREGYGSIEIKLDPAGAQPVDSRRPDKDDG